MSQISKISIYPMGYHLKELLRKLLKIKVTKDRVNEEKRLLSMEERTIAFLDQMGL